MQSDKTARKRQRTVQQAPENLVFQKPFEFFVPLPMQECIVRLKFATQEAVYLARVAPNKVEFNFVQRGSKFGDMWAVGYIEEIHESQTCIGVKIGVPRTDLILTVFLVMAAISIFIFSDPLSSGTCFAVVVMTPIWIIVAFLNYLWGRGNIMQKLRIISLGASK